jgi:hypothetical protein
LRLCMRKPSLAVYAATVRGNGPWVTEFALDDSSNGNPIWRPAGA